MTMGAVGLAAHSDLSAVAGSVALALHAGAIPAKSGGPSASPPVPEGLDLGTPLNFASTADT